MSTHIDFPHWMLQVERQILSRYTSDHFIAQCHYLLYWNTIHLRFYPARLGTVMRIMRGANHDRPMMMAGPTPNRDISPVARGRPTISSMVEKIYSKCYHILIRPPSLPMTVETAAKFWAASWLDCSSFDSGRKTPNTSLKMKLKF